MRQFLALLLIIGAIWGGKQLYNYWETVKAKKETEDRGGAPPPTTAPVASTVLPGLPANLEASLQAAQKQGVAGLKNWLNLYRPYASDPRLAAIELDYVVFIRSTNPQAARRLLPVGKQRPSPDSPVYPATKRRPKCSFKNRRHRWKSPPKKRRRNCASKPSGGPIAWNSGTTTSTRS